MRFDGIDILVDLSRLLGGALMGIGLIGGIANWVKLQRGDVFYWPLWTSSFFSGLALIIICTGVLAQIITARASQDSLTELRAIRKAVESAQNK